MPTSPRDTRGRRERVSKRCASGSLLCVSERAWGRSSCATNRGDEERAEQEMDDQARGRLHGKRARGDFVAVHHDLERLHDDVAYEDRAERRAGCAPRHPVDDAEADEGGAHVAREHDALVRRPEAEAGEHGGGEDKQGKPEHEGGDRAEHERKTWAQRAGVYL